MKKQFFVLLVSIVYLLASSSVFARVYQSPYAFLCPLIDGKCNEIYWSKAFSIDFPYGKLMIKNNYQYVYFLLDVIEDTYEDKSMTKPVCEDYFELYFDWDGNGSLTRNFDRVYLLCNQSGRLVYRYIIESNVFSKPYASHGQVKAGFGPTFNSSRPHRFYEVKIPLSEVRISSNDFLRLGFSVVSKRPYINYQQPVRVTEHIEQFYTIRLSFPPKNIELIYTLNLKEMKLNQEVFAMDVAPYIHSGRIFLPIRYVVEPFGGVFEWNSDLQRLVIMIQEEDIIMKVNSPKAMHNGKEVSIDEDPSVTAQWRPPGRVMIPLRFIAETIGCRVSWDHQKQQALVRFSRN